MKILAAPIVAGACGTYRVEQPLKMLHEHYPDVQTEIIKDNFSNELIHKGIEMSDILLVRQSTHKFIGRIEALKETYKKHGATLTLKTVLDLDDNLFDWSPFTDAYKNCGLKEVPMSQCMDRSWFKDHPEDEHKWLWKDGQEGFDLKRNKEGADLLLQALKRADLITTPSPDLCDFYSRMSGNKNVAVLPNCVDFSEWKQLEMVKKDVRVGWHGGSSHYIDLETIRERLIDVVEREFATYVHSGSSFERSFTMSQQVESEKWVPMAAHPYRMANLNLDIGVIPLAKFDFNKYKSDIKWVEYSALQIPCVVANCKPYSSVILHGVTGFLYDTLEELDYYLTALIRNTELRRKIGKNAFEWCYEHRNAHKQAHLWKEAYDALLD